MAFREQQPVNRRPPLRPVERQVEIDVERTRRTTPAPRSVLETGAMGLGLVNLIMGLASYLSPLIAGGDVGFFNTGPGKLFGLFGVNGLNAFVHTIIGLAGVLMARKLVNSRTFLWVAGIIFGILALSGFATSQAGLYNLMGMMNNRADNWLHTLFALIAFGCLYAANKNRRQAVT